MRDKSKLNQNNTSQILTWFKEFALDKKFNDSLDDMLYIKITHHIKRVKN